MKIQYFGESHLSVENTSPISKSVLSRSLAIQNEKDTPAIFPINTAFSFHQGARHYRFPELEVPMIGAVTPPPVVTTIVIRLHSFAAKSSGELEPSS